MEFVKRVVSDFAFVPQRIHTTLMCADRTFSFSNFSDYSYRTGEKGCNLTTNLPAIKAIIRELANKNKSVSVEACSCLRPKVFRRSLAKEKSTGRGR